MCCSVFQFFAVCDECGAGSDVFLLDLPTALQSALQWV